MFVQMKVRILMRKPMIMMGSGSITTVRMFRMDNKVLGINAGCHLQPQLSQRSRAQHAESLW